MINEIYINDQLIVNENPKKQFKNGYKIRCVNCKELIDRKWYDKNILESQYECKTCILKYKNPMHNPIVKERHNQIVNSIEYRENMSMLASGKNNGFYGKTHTDETKKIIIQANKDYWNSMSDEDRNKMSINASIREKKKMENDPIGYRKKRSIAAKISHKTQFGNLEMNGIERRVYDFINRLGIEIEFSVILASYQYDFCIKEKRILIEVDGDYWHGNPKYYNEDGIDGKRKLNNIQLNKIKIDDEKTKWARSRGFTLIRIWESEINDGSFKDKLIGYIDEIKKN